MTPFKIALAIRNKPDDGEPDTDFVLRTMSGESARDFVAAADLLEGWDRGHDDFAKLVELLTPAGRKTTETTIGALIKYKRALGYDPALEALLARRWRCPHCKQFTTIDKVQLPIGDATRLPRCVMYGEEGVAPVDTEARLDVRDGGKSGQRPT